MRPPFTKEYGNFGKNETNCLNFITLEDFREAGFDIDGFKQGTSSYGGGTYVTQCSQFFDNPETKISYGFQINLMIHIVEGIKREMNDPKYYTIHKKLNIGDESYLVKDKTFEEYGLYLFRYNSAIFLIINSDDEINIEDYSNELESLAKIVVQRIDEYPATP